MAVTDDALIIDQKSLGCAIDAPLDRDLTVPIDRYGVIGITELREPTLGQEVLILPIEADDHDVVASGDLEEHLVLDPALRAPGAPDIEKVPSTTHRGRVEIGRPIERWQAEHRRGLAEQGRRDDALLR